MNNYIDTQHNAIFVLQTANETNTGYNTYNVTLNYEGPLSKTVVRSAIDIFRQETGYTKDVIVISIIRLDDEYITLARDQVIGEEK